MICHLRAAWLQPLIAALAIGVLTALAVAVRWHLPLPKLDLVVSSLALGASAAGAIAGHAVATSPPLEQSDATARPGWQVRLVPLSAYLLVAYLALAPTAAHAGAGLLLLRQLALCTGTAIVAARLCGRVGATLPILWAMSVIMAGRDGTEVAMLWRPLYATTPSTPTTGLTILLGLTAAAAIAGQTRMTKFGHRLARLRHHTRLGEARAR